MGWRACGWLNRRASSASRTGASTAASPPLPCSPPQIAPSLCCLVAPLGMLLDLYSGIHRKKWWKLEWYLYSIMI